MNTGPHRGRGSTGTDPEHWQTGSHELSACLPRGQAQSRPTHCVTGRGQAHSGHHGSSPRRPARAAGARGSFPLHWAIFSPRTALNGPHPASNRGPTLVAQGSPKRSRPSRLRPCSDAHPRRARRSPQAACAPTPGKCCYQARRALLQQRVRSTPHAWLGTQAASMPVLPVSRRCSRRRGQRPCPPRTQRLPSEAGRAGRSRQARAPAPAACRAARRKRGRRRGPPRKRPAWHRLQPS